MPDTRPVTRGELRTVLWIVVGVLVFWGILLLGANALISYEQTNAVKQNQIEACYRGNVIRAEINVSRIYTQRTAEGVLNIIKLAPPPDPYGDIKTIVKQLDAIANDVLPVKYIDCEAIY